MEITIIFAFVIIIVWLKNYYHKKETEIRTRAVIRYLETAGSDVDSSEIISKIANRPDYREELISRLKGGLIWTGIGLVWLIMRVACPFGESFDAPGDELSEAIRNSILPWLIPAIVVVVGVAKLVSYCVAKKAYSEELGKDYDRKTV